MAATTSTPTVGTRSVGIDTLRIVGLAAVVVGHVWIDDTTRAVIYTWHVPLFFILTGYFWSAGRPMGGELRKRWQTLGVPYLTWLVLLLAMLAAVAAVKGGVGPDAFSGALYGGTAAVRPFSAFWFISVLFLIAVAYRWLERFGTAVSWGVALVGLLAAYLAPDVVTAGPLGVFLVPACLLFVLCGRHLRQLRPRLSAGMGAGMVSAGAGLVLIGASGSLDIKAGDFGKPVFGVLTATLLSCGFILLAEALDGRVGVPAARAVGRLAACGMAVVLSHAAVLWVLRTGPNGGWVDLAAALVLPWAFALAVLRTRFGPQLTGAGGRRP
ncbi:acyltransferase [Micromonospora sp. NPDC047465]|uniref:acyltransferase family protein n=1 Tax=Micromonospora sp. NPDC047465 TaxID=3154813 RepID=UPI0033D78AD2